jgi:hypothetical protein
MGLCGIDSRRFQRLQRAISPSLGCVWSAPSLAFLRKAWKNIAKWRAIVDNRRPRFDPD